MRVKQIQPAHKIHYSVDIHFTFFSHGISCYEKEFHYVTQIERFRNELYLSCHGGDCEEFGLL
jgi:hypothetical protein